MTNVGSLIPKMGLDENEAGAADIVKTSRVIAVVGMKDETEPDAAAFEVPRTVQARGFRVIPVNPKIKAALGERAYPNLAAIGAPVDLVNVFRRSDVIGEVADDILALPPEHRPRAVWLQSGIRNDAAAARLVAAGLRVVQDRCLGVYVGRYARGRS
jgi:uncharacterized protein